jgi:hypothetical protein
VRAGGEGEREQEDAVRHVVGAERKKIDAPRQGRGAGAAASGAC